MIRLKLHELYEKTGQTQKEVATKGGFRVGTLSGLANNRRATLDVDIIDRLCVYFKITDMNDLIEFVPNNNASIAPHVLKSDQLDEEEENDE